MAIIEHFTMKEDHLKLLDHMYWEWGEYGVGAPCADSKRPYGNSHSIGMDVAEICDWPEFEALDPNDEGEEGMAAYDELNERGLNVHRQTLNALQIIIQLRTFELGDYTRIGDMWKRAGRSP